MITAHLPSGYVLYRLVARTVDRERTDNAWVFWACLVGATWPDLDLIWFYLVDDKAFHHHRYWVHAPGFWLIAVLISVPLISRMQPALRRANIAFFAAWLMHLCLDTIVGSIMWLWPFSDQFFQLATVQPTHNHFVLSFMAHWSFAIELAIWLAAGTLWWRRSAQ